MTPTRRNWWSFAALLGLQTQNAFNDNTVRFLLLPLGTALAAASEGQALAYYQHLLGALLVLPYIFFSPLAGWIADRFPKNRVILASLLMQTVVFLVIALSVQGRLLWLATAGFFFLALQSTLLSPAKSGVIKELVGSTRLGLANGLMELTLILAILAGMFLGGWWFDLRLDAVADVAADKAPWIAANGPIWILTAATLIALALAFGVEHTPSRMPNAKFHGRLLWGHFHELRRLFRDKGLRLSAIGVMYFWFVGALVQLAIVQAAKSLTGGAAGMGTAVSVMIACASGGVAIGSLIAGLVCRKGTELGLVPVGALLMAVGGAVAACSVPGSAGFNVGLALLGVSSAMFFVPLFAYFQEVAPESARGRLLASSNLLNNLAMIGATLLQLGFVASGLSVRWQFALLALTTLVVGIYVVRLLPQRFFRILITPVFRFVYRMRVEGAELIPPQGGALLVANHASYLDAFILSTACRRNIRFLMLESYYRQPWAKWFLDLFRVIPVTPTKAKDAIRKATAGLAAGELVCLFPEGKLTTDGKVDAFQRGMEMILRGHPVPVVIGGMSGLWGSWFSFHGGAPFRGLPRWPQPVTVRFLPPQPPTLTAAEAEAMVRELVGESGAFPQNIE